MIDRLNDDTVKIKVKTPKGDIYTTLTDVLYSHDLPYNVVATSRLQEEGISRKNQALYRNGEPFIQLTEIENFLVLEDNTKNTT